MKDIELSYLGYSRRKKIDPGQERPGSKVIAATEMMFASRINQDEAYQRLIEPLLKIVRRQGFNLSHSFVLQ